MESASLRIIAIFVVKSCFARLYLSNYLSQPTPHLTCLFIFICNRSSHGWVMQQTCRLSVLVLLWKSLEIIGVVRLLNTSIIMHISSYINSLLHFLSCSKGLLKTMLVHTYLMMAVVGMLRKKMTGQLLFSERLLGKLLLKHLMVSDGSSVVSRSAIALEVKQVDNLARRCWLFERVARRESIATTAQFVIKYVHLHLLLHWLMRDNVLLVEFLLGDWFTQARDALGGCLGLHSFVASVDAEMVDLFALSVVKIILLVSWRLLGRWHNNQMLLLLIALLRCFLSSATRGTHIWIATIALRLLQQFQLIFNKFSRTRTQMLLLCLLHGCLPSLLVKPETAIGVVLLHLLLFILKHDYFLLSLLFCTVLAICCDGLRIDCLRLEHFGVALGIDTALVLLGN